MPWYLFPDTLSSPSLWIVAREALTVASFACWGVSAAPDLDWY